MPHPADETRNDPPMIDDVFLPQARCAAVADEESFERRLRRSVCAPIHHTPGDFGLDQLWTALDAERRAQRRRLCKRRLLRYVASLKRSVLGLLEAGRPT